MIVVNRSQGFSAMCRPSGSAMFSPEGGIYFFYINLFCALLKFYSKSDVLDSLSSLGIAVENSDSCSKEEDCKSQSIAKFDHACPKVMSLGSSLRPTLSRSQVVRDGHLILQVSYKPFHLIPALWSSWWGLCQVAVRLQWECMFSIGPKFLHGTDLS